MKFQKPKKQIPVYSSNLTSDSGTMGSHPVFDSLTILSYDPGIIGFELRQLPNWEWILAEADKCNDPWKFLLAISNLSKPFKRLFEAGLSQRTAWMRIAEIAVGAGSIEKSWFQEIEDAEQAGDINRVAHARQKVCKALWKYDRSIFSEPSINHLSNEAARTLRKIDQAIYQKTRRKHGSAKADSPCRPINHFKFETITEKIALTLVPSWLRNKNAVPGYCFFSDIALSDFLGIYLNLHGLGLETVRKTRQFLRLKKASTVIYELKKLSDGTINLLDRRKHPVWKVTIDSSSNSG